MSYFQRVRWISHDRQDPAVLWSHIIDHREAQKVEEFADGRLAWADTEHQQGDTRLSVVPMPTIEEIACNPQFEAEMIDESDFERVRQRARCGA